MRADPARLAGAPLLGPLAEAAGPLTPRPAPPAGARVLVAVVLPEKGGGGGWAVGGCFHGDHSTAATGLGLEAPGAFKSASETGAHGPAAGGNPGPFRPPPDPDRGLGGGAPAAAAPPPPRLGLL